MHITILTMDGRLSDFTAQTSAQSSQLPNITYIKLFVCTYMYSVITLSEYMCVLSNIAAYQFFPRPFTTVTVLCS